VYVDKNTPLSSCLGSRVEVANLRQIWDKLPVEVLVTMAFQQWDDGDRSQGKGGGSNHSRDPGCHLLVRPLFVC